MSHRNRSLFGWSATTPTSRRGRHGRALLAVCICAEAAALLATCGGVEREDEHGPAQDAWCEVEKLFAWDRLGPEGVASDGEPFFRIAGVSQVGAYVAVVEMDPPGLRYFDGNGHTVYEARGGEGPGEYVRPTNVTRIKGDSLFVYDSGLQRVTVLGADEPWVGRLVRLRGGGDFAPYVGGALPGAGGIVGVGGMVTSPDGFRPGPFRPDLPLLFFDDEGAFVRKIGVIPSGTHIHVGRGPKFVRPLLPLASVWATTDSFVVVGTGNEPDLTAINSLGDQRTFHRGAEPSVLTDEDVDEIMAVRGEETGRPDVVEASVEIAGRPATLPPYQGLVTAENGLAWLWLGDYPDPRRPSRRWKAIDPGGKVVAEADFPRDFDMTDIRDGRAVGIATNALGEEWVEGYRVTCDMESRSR